VGVEEGETLQLRVGRGEGGFPGRGAGGGRHAQWNDAAAPAAARAGAAAASRSFPSLCVAMVEGINKSVSVGIKCK
jgi:hypothetical protein